MTDSSIFVLHISRTSLTPNWRKTPLAGLSVMFASDFQTAKNKEAVMENSF